MKQQAMLCPRCRRLVGSDETSCSWCGTARPAGWWQRAAWTRGALDGEWLVRAIITVTIAYYLLSLFLSSGRASSRSLLGALGPDQTGLLLLGATGTIPIDRFGHVWTLISATYLHGGILHLVFNLMALRQIAPWVNHEYGPN